MQPVHTNDHPDSYYFSSLKYNEQYPCLTENIDTEICIIGGGFSGINSAIELAERGYQVTVVEAFKIGWGASGRNGGQLIRGIGHDLSKFKKNIGDHGVEAISAMGNEANKIVIDRIKKYQINCDLTMGYATLATREKHMRELEQEFQMSAKGDDAQTFSLVDKVQIKTNIVGSDNYIGGLVDMGSGHLHPLNLCTGEAKIAQSLGVRIFEHSKVESIRSGSTISVKTAKGVISAKKLIIAGNAYVGDLVPKISNKILPAGSYVIATEPLAESVYSKLLPNNHAVCDMKIDLDYFRLSADKRLLFGGLCNYSGREPKDITAVLYPKMLSVFPQLENTKIDYQWGGNIGIGANRLPQIGRLEDNVFYAQAYSGHGVNVTHMAAKVIAETIAGESQRIEHFEKVKHMAFPGGKHLRSPLLALGMLYHKCLDKL